jgi:dipeptidyl aminopeptidase/acylaminoacyl peptidase
MRRVHGNRRRWCPTAAISLAGAAIAFGQVTPSDEQKKMLTPEASLNLRNIADLQFSGDGGRLAFVVTEPAKGTGRLRHIWIYDVASGVARQVTFSAKTELTPRWRPEPSAGETPIRRLAFPGELAFLSDREEGQQQIYLISMNGGEGRAITKGKRSVKAFEWSPDGKTIAYLAPDAKTEEEEKKEKDKDDAKVVDKDDKHARLWILDVATGETRALTKANWNFDELAWLPTGDRVVVKGTDTPGSDEYTERIFTVQVADGAMKQLAKPQGPFGEMRVAPDGKTISYVGPREDGPEPHDLMLLPVTAHAARNLTGASLDRLVQDYHWAKDGSVVLVAANGFSNLLVTYGNDGARHDLVPATGPAGSMALAGDGEIAFVSQGATRPQEVWLWDQKSAPRQVTHLNDSWKEYALAQPEFYTYKSFDGVEIQAALLRPRVSPSANQEIGVPGKSKLPLIALIHGGPTGRWADSVETWG